MSRRAAWAAGLVALGWVLLGGLAGRLSDDGLHAYAGRALLHGQLPYRDFEYHQPPLLPVVLAGWYRLVGVGLLQARLAAALVAVATLLLNWRLAVRAGAERGLGPVAWAVVASPSVMLHLGYVQSQGLATLLALAAAWCAMSDRRGVRLAAWACVAGAVAARVSFGILLVPLAFARSLAAGESQAAHEEGRAVRESRAAHEEGRAAGESQAAHEEGRAVREPPLPGLLLFAALTAAWLVPAWRLGLADVLYLPFGLGGNLLTRSYTQLYAFGTGPLARLASWPNQIVYYAPLWVMVAVAALHRRRPLPPDPLSPRERVRVRAPGAAWPGLSPSARAAESEEPQPSRLRPHPNPLPGGEGVGVALGRGERVGAPRRGDRLILAFALALTLAHGVLPQRVNHSYLVVAMPFWAAWAATQVTGWPRGTLTRGLLVVATVLAVGRGVGRLDVRGGPGVLRLSRAAAEIRALTAPDEPLFTFAVELAVAADRDVWPGCESGYFSLYPNLTGAEAARCHVLTAAALDRLLAARQPPWLVLHDGAFGPAERPRQEWPAVGRWWSLVRSGYEPVTAWPRLGEKRQTVRLWRRLPVTGRWDRTSADRAPGHLLPGAADARPPRRTPSRGPWQ